MIADDLFAGAGGWDLAAEALGIHSRGIEIMSQARATRDAAGLTTIHDDVWTFEPDGSASILIASPPCQTFSTAGKGAGRKALDDVLRGVRDGYAESLDHLRFLGAEVGDERTALVLTPLHFALTGGYEALAWEQVPTVLPVWEVCAERLREDGWNVWTGLLHAEQYGVPQTRKRAFLLASRRGEVRPPVPTHSRYHPRSPERLDEGVEKWVSMAEALDQRSNRVAWQRRNSGPAAARSPRSVDEPAYTVRAQGSGSHPSGIELIPDWAHNRPATTIVGSFRPDIVAAPGYRTTVSRQDAPNSVRVTVQEAGILQSFPADFAWQGSKTKQYLQVGNAVPPLLAHAALGAVVTQAQGAAA